MDNHSSKYHAARKSKVHTVTAKWLKESSSQDFFLNPVEFLFPLFYQQKFHFFDCETKELVKKVRDHRAEVVVDADSSMIKSLVIVIPNNDIENYINILRKEYSFFENAFEENILKLVTVPWIDAYISKDYDILDTYQVLAVDHKAPSEEVRCSFTSRNDDRF
jgi:hypothetical protein